MMSRSITIILLLALSGCERLQEQKPVSAQDVARQLAAVKIDPGQWQSTTQILSAKGPLPQEVLARMIDRRSRTSHCITPEQAARPSANFLAAQQGSDCTYQKFDMARGKLAGEMTCTGGTLPGRVVTVMNGAYGPQGYDMVMDMEAPSLPGGAPMQIRARTQGKRVGSCA